MQHRILRPLLFHLSKSKPFEEILPPLEIALESRYEQRLSEPSRTAQEEVFAVSMCYPVNIFRFVDIEIVFFANLLKSLNPYRIEFPFHI